MAGRRSPVLFTWKWCLRLASSTPSSMMSRTMVSSLCVGRSRNLSSSCELWTEELLELRLRLVRLLFSLSLSRHSLSADWMTGYFELNDSLGGYLGLAASKSCPSSKLKLLLGIHSNLLLWKLMGAILSAEFSLTPNCLIFSSIRGHNLASVWPYLPFHMPLKLAPREEISTNYVAPICSVH